MDGVVKVVVARASDSPAASQLLKMEEKYRDSLRIFHGYSAVVSMAGVEMQMELLVGHDDGERSLPK